MNAKICKHSELTRLLQTGIVINNADNTMINQYGILVAKGGGDLRRIAGT